MGSQFVRTEPRSQAGVRRRFRGIPRCSVYFRIVTLISGSVKYQSSTCLLRVSNICHLTPVGSRICE